MNPLINIKSNIFENILQDIQDKDISISYLTDSSKAHIIYGLTVRGKKSSLVCCANTVDAHKMVTNLKFYSDISVEYFPAKELIYYDIEAESKENLIDRMSIIKNILLDKNKKIIVTTIDALMQNMPDFDNRLNNLETYIDINTKVNLDEFVNTLINMGYERCENIEGKSQFAVRGGIIDVFPIESKLPVRIEFFGDEIDNIRTFDLITQRSIDTLHHVNITFVKENNIDKSTKDDAIKKINKLIESEECDTKLKDYLKEDLDKIENDDTYGIIDKYFQILVKNKKKLLDYLKDYNIFINEPQKCLEKSYNLINENQETLNVLEEKNYIYRPFVAKYLNYDDTFDGVKNRIYLENLKISNSNKSYSKEYVLDFKEQNFYKNSFETLLSDVKKHKDYLKILVFPTKVREEQVSNFLIDNKVNVLQVNDIFDVDITRKDTVYIMQSVLSNGYVSDNLKLYILTESVTGTNSKFKKLRKSKPLGSVINSYDDLQIGDYIVHENHGIGIYRGISTISVQNVIKDYIKLEYQNGGILYVPINQLDSVTKYISDEDKVVKLNSLNGKDWEKTKKNVQEHVYEIAKELISLYAKREKSKGYAFEKDSQWQKEFEDSFEYELTPDQKQAVMDVKADMESDKIMDRLLCGDVGYGKTEVALRAAFKAVMSGKQVAYLVPTTVLSMQQYQTFKSRMDPFGVKVEMLSRFKSKAEQTEILKGLIDGKIDVVIGTHRLLSKDVYFKDLGFLIIDEEHRFGVKAKEAIKTLKENIDVLSMTATPIPRTLHMSLVGIRSMSTLTEPPLERLPVHTYVLEYDDVIIKEAIEKELLRDGQVFYISNRVEDIEEVTNKVKNLVPNARVGFAHGQMSPDEIEDVMIKFINHDLDIIVCTTILETGIDIRNANTIIIENADKLGLAQLYQIRGRVGRSNRLAYAYITYEKNKQISEISEKRLKAIRDFTEFGSGFKIALRDLEIRGAGSLLGSKQHRSYG